MQVNLPFLEAFSYRNFLIAGAGGGFDVFAGLPLCHELAKREKGVKLFNYSFTNLDAAESDLKTHEPNNYLYGFKGKVQKCPDRKDKKYFPEGYLAEYIVNDIVYACPKMGVVPTRKALQRVVEREQIDCVILVDGGVDSLMRGDEAEAGTILEDSVSLAALKDVDVPCKLLVTVGFGTELEDNLNHYLVLQNMAGLVAENALLGSCCLLKDQQGFQFMKQAYQYVTRQPDHATSHITPRIIEAVEGGFRFEGGVNYSQGTTTPIPPVFIQPLMNLYWFWDAGVVTAQNKLIDKTFCQTNTFTDVTMLYRQKMVSLVKRSRGPAHAILA